MANIKSFYDTDIALMEHEFIKEGNILETDGEYMKWYLAGVHDFADKIIEKIREKEGF